MLLSLAVGSLSGCGGLVITERSAPRAPAVPVSQRPPAGNVPNKQETHDLAITAIDFDPALDSPNLSSAKNRTLLVAVENKGNRREGPFTVYAQLLSQDRREALLSAQQTVPVLAPGDITVVRFPNDTLPPRQRTYILNARVQTVPKEANTTNNQRVLEVEVKAGN